MDVCRWHPNKKEGMEKTFCGLLGVIYLLCANAPLLLIGHCPGEGLHPSPLFGHLVCQLPLFSPWIYVTSFPLTAPSEGV